MAKTLEPLARPPLLHQSVLEAIKAYIIDNGLQPGSVLPAETEFARRFGVSRTSVREAVKALESVGLIEAHRGSGLKVREFSLQPFLENLTYGRFDLDELAEITEVRRALEIGMIEKAMARMSAATLDELRQAVARMGAHAERGQADVEADRRFHQLLFAGVNNRTLLTFLDAFWLTFYKVAAHADVLDADLMPTYRDHQAIVEAIAAHDVEAARRSLDRHYDRQMERLELLRQERAS
jgi:DNA-binding FadR family transcriptional regulator